MNSRERKLLVNRIMQESINVFTENKLSRADMAQLCAELAKAYSNWLVAYLSEEE